MANLPPTHLEWSQTQTPKDQERTSECPGDPTGPQASAEPDPKPLPALAAWEPLGLVSCCLSLSLC